MRKIIEHAVKTAKQKYEYLKKNTKLNKNSTNTKSLKQN